MNYYKILRYPLFALPEEMAHHICLWGIKHNLAPRPTIYKNDLLKIRLWGMDFDNPLGIAAGLDKDAEAIAGLASQGIGFLETGTVTPLPQPGNPKPRLFRLIKDKAIINKLGFPSKGVVPYVENLKNWQQNRTSNVIVGSNLGKNKLSDKPTEDYVSLIKQVYDYSDFITINISSPNTEGLRDLQTKEPLNELLAAVRETVSNLQQQRKVPILLKISPDESSSTLETIAESSINHGIDGIIISNTTKGERENLIEQKYAQHEGGLSGAPLFKKSTESLQEMYKLVGDKVPLIGLGGISNGEEAYTKIRSGASLIQIYSALIYEGFAVINQINHTIAQLLERDGLQNIGEAVGMDVKK